MNKKTLKRLMTYVMQYKIRFVLVFVCIIISAAASVTSALFVGTLIDDYIEPLLLEAHPVYSGLLKAILIMAAIFIVGILATLMYNRIMVAVAQGVLKKIRDEMFEHMQTLPVKYFDTHTHGDVMSYYTNDTDTLRQAIAQSIPQMISSAITICAVFIAMLSTSIWLSAFVLVFVVLMLQITKKIASKSGKYFFRQQQSLADVDGFIEEMINGQKVVKVFCHEEQAKEEFDKKNENLCKNAYKANKFANILMPVMNNLG
ncbi:MAG: ABC transporter ATP-binding protein, partial [Lachnospiraceae bacterium]|nr:ABC transporter ATP-binding protein [Lachnospiraceae bacterium]